jgi:parvulin-like peptidyl-prolyl isomerase
MSGDERTVALNTEDAYRKTIAFGLLIALLAVPVWADEPAQGKPQTSDSVIARVNGEPIYQHELDRELAPAAKLLDPQAALPAEVRQRALDQLIDRRLVLKYLTEQKLIASDQDVDLEIGRLKRRLEAQEKKLTEHLKAGGITEEELRRDIRWRLSWQRYLAGRLTDENLEKYFSAHRREFDGTELKVAHLLIKPANPADPLSLEEALHKAKGIRDQIESGKLTFADACRQHSQAPTAKGGGDIGFILRHEPMPEAFSAAAFALDKDQVSEPVQTRFGIHLIQVVEIKPGQRTWQECRGELRSAVTQYLFRWIAGKQREMAQVEASIAN